MTIDLGKNGGILLAVLIIGAGLASWGYERCGIVRNRRRSLSCRPCPRQLQPATETPSPIQVFVSGEVKAPDVYALCTDQPDQTACGGGRGVYRGG